MSMVSEQERKTRMLIIRLLSNIGSTREIRQYLKRFANLDRSRFAVVKVGGAVLRDDLDSLADSLSFLHQVGLLPIVIHGAGPQLDQAMSAAGIEKQTYDGLRVTPREGIGVVRRVMLDQNLRLVEALDRVGTRARAITSGVFEAQWKDREQLGYVGDVCDVHLQSVRASIEANAIPVLTCMGETADGQKLNINADAAANELVRAVEPFKVIFLTATGGLLDANEALISSINLRSDFELLMKQPWVHSGMRLKLAQINQLLHDLPPASSVSMTRPEELAKELFTHAGSGTLVRRGERIDTYQAWAKVDRSALQRLIESAFARPLAPDYFTRTPLEVCYLTECSRAGAVISKWAEYPLLDKFVVADAARGEGLGRAVWETIRREHTQLIWRARHDNPINDFYFQESDGCIKDGEWNAFWYGIEDMREVEACAAHLIARPATLLDPR